MTDAPRLIVVADAGPLIHLDELGALELLADFEQVLVAETVWNEVEKHRARALATNAIRWRRCHAAVNIRVDALLALYGLHQGEREALSLCLDAPEALLLTDDAAARLAAGSLGIQAHGTLGILVRAIRRRQRDKQQVLNLLKQIPERSSLHIRAELLANIVRQVADEAD
ncbi:MAG: hypothetical protein QM741_04860 [Rudaea sp.]|uniref:hypothetical protein n=1 Tax=Rudaea sp. TaxID=2136325 RepID=UPI0039E39F9E